MAIVSSVAVVVDDTTIRLSIREGVARFFAFENPRARPYS
jgi:hypothetical protein